MARAPIRARVESTEWLTPRMVRIVLGGDELERFEAGEFTDHYVKVQLPPPGASYSAPFDVEELRERLPRDELPRIRSYTVREWDPELRRLTLDFVVHGDVGIAGPWASGAKPGDMLQLMGPGGAYTPDSDAAWHLMVGDPSVLPAIAASLPRIPEGVPVHVLVEVDDDDDRVELTSPGDLHVRWLERDTSAEVLRGFEFPPGDVHAFIHGEASVVREVRRHLVADRGIPREALSVSGYWKRTLTDEEWRAAKAEWKAQVEQDDAALSR